MDYALAVIAGGRPVRLVCASLGVARSHIAALLDLPADWVDRRTARHSRDDSALLGDIRQVVRDLGTYGYRRVWGVLRHQPVNASRPTPNHKTVYRVMRDHGLLLYRRATAGRHTPA